jgi:hypothetical protein
MDLRDIGWQAVDWIHVAEDNSGGGNKQTIRFVSSGGHMSDARAYCFSLSRRTLLHGVNYEQHCTSSLLHHLSFPRNNLNLGRKFSWQTRAAFVSKTEI